MGKHTRGEEAVAPDQPEHPSQAEGEDPKDPGRGEDAPKHGHPSQAEGEDDGRSE